MEYLPTATVYTPAKIIVESARSLAAVKMLWILMAHLTLKQLMAVRRPVTND